MRRTKAEIIEERKELELLLEEQLRAAGYYPTGEYNSFGEIWLKEKREVKLT